MSFSDGNNPMFPSPQEIHILECTKDIRFTCNLNNCLWNISHQDDVILTTTYTIPELSTAYNGIISLQRETSNGTLYTTAQISIYVIQQESESNNSTVFIIIIVLLIIFIVVATAIVILILICRKTNAGTTPTGEYLPKKSSAAFPGYANLTTINSTYDD